MTNYDEPSLRRARSVDADTRGMMQIRRRLGDVLVESGLLTPQQLEQALEEQRKDTGPRRRLGQVVADLGLAAERDVAKALADLLGLELIDLSRMLPAPDVVRLLPRAVAERTRVLVLDRTSNGLVVAAADPTNVLALDDVKLYTRTPELHVLVATDSQIRDQIARAWNIQHDSADVSAMVDSVDDDDDAGPVIADIPVGTEDAPIVKLVNQILGDAVHLGASRHPPRGAARRPAGSLPRRRPAARRHERAQADRDLGGQPDQGGLGPGHRGAAGPAGRAHPLQRRRAGHRRPGLAPCPRLHGEKVVIRLLTRGDNVPPLDELGFEPRQLALFRSALSVPQGLVLITGPTGFRQDEHAVLGDRGDPQPRTRTSSRSRTPSRSSCPGSPRSASARRRA